MSIRTSQGIVNNVGVCSKWSVPDFSDPKFTNIGQIVDAKSRSTMMPTKTDAGIQKTKANTTKEGIIGPYDAKFNIVN